MIQKQQIVKVSKLLPFPEKQFDELLVNSRRAGKIGIVDSPIYSVFNRYWLVKQRSWMKRGMVFSCYAIYHEDELETINIEDLDLPQTNEISSQPMHLNNDDDDWNGY